MRRVRSETAQVLKVLKIEQMRAPEWSSRAVARRAWEIHKARGQARHAQYSIGARYQPAQPCHPAYDRPTSWWTGKAPCDRASFSAFGPMFWRSCLISMERSAGELRARSYDASVK